MTVRRADRIAAKIERQLQNSIEDLHMITVKVESRRSEGDSNESTTEQAEAKRF
jgi:divalent metal cation (Fe/Co/Zn/Cd) transporter